VNRLTLFGGAVLDAEGGPIAGRAMQRHRIALMALLSTTRRPHRSRDQLATFLWPDANAERGRKLLSDSIYRINQALGGDAITGTGEDVRLNRDQVGSDVADFEAAVDSRDWRRTVELYAGPFLDGFYLPAATEFDQWMESERTQHARTVAKAVEALAVDARDAGRVAEAVDWWQRLAALAPDDSRVAKELMRALESSGNRAGALRHARVHAVVLRETLGLEPDRSVQELADQIAARAEAPVSAVIPAADTVPAAVTATATPPAPAIVANELAATVPREETPRTAVARGLARWSLLPALAAILAVFAIGLLERSTGAASRAATAPVPGRSIAVLPFNTVSDSSTTAYFADGMSEELMYLLARTPGLRVASPTSAFAYRDVKLDVREVAQRLHVDWILEGSVRRSGRQLRIVAQLTDATTGYQIWSESFDRTSSDAFATQKEIAAAIANRLATTTDGAVGAASVLGSRGAASELSGLLAAVESPQNFCGNGLFLP
jgi:TolB-like protein/DNA-binding SARP family transcriptional activator